MRLNPVAEIGKKLICGTLEVEWKPNGKDATRDPAVSEGRYGKLRYSTDGTRDAGQCLFIEQTNKPT